MYDGDCVRAGGRAGARGRAGQVMTMIQVRYDDDDDDVQVMMVDSVQTDQIRLVTGVSQSGSVVRQDR